MTIDLDMMEIVANRMANHSMFDENAADLLALIRLARADVAMYQIDVVDWPGADVHRAAWNERDAAISPFLPEEAP